jgi:hypothetical protein
MMPLIFGTQFIVGTLLLANRFVPLALALLAPFIVNSVAFHSFLEPSGRPIALTLLALEVYLAWTYRKAYHDMLLPKTTLATRGKANRPEQPDEGPVIDDIRRRGDLEDMLQLVRNDRDERRLTLRTENFHPKVADIWSPRHQGRPSRQQETPNATACHMHDDIRLLDAFNNQPKRWRAVDDPVKHQCQLVRLRADSLEAFRPSTNPEDRHEQKGNRRACTLSL